MSTIEEHLGPASGNELRRRLSLDAKASRFPNALAKLARKTIWSGGWKHLRKFDHRYGFVRDGIDLVSMTEDGKELLKLEPLHRLIGEIDRPVSLVTLGPSANDFDWDTLRMSGRMVVAVSAGATFLKERGITPALIVVSDPDFSTNAGYHVESAPGVPLVVEYRAAVALRKRFPGTLEDRKVTVLERADKWYGAPAFGRSELEKANLESGSPFRISPVPDDLLRAGWSDKPELGFFPSATVALVALQVIVALGARDIEIIGMDLGGGNSLYKDVGNSRLEQEYQAVILPSFREMAAALAGRGVRISNLSPTCPLPAEIFGGEP